MEKRETKVCKDCGLEKPIGDFASNRGRWLSSYCRACARERTAKWSEENPEKRQKMSRKAHLLRKYGMSPEQYDSLFNSQAGVCVICARPPKRRRLSVLRVGGVITGLACYRCIVGLGYFCHSAETLRAAADHIGYAHRLADEAAG